MSSAGIETNVLIVGWEYWTLWNGSVRTMTLAVFTRNMMMAVYGTRNATDFEKKKEAKSLHH